MWFGHEARCRERTRGRSYCGNSIGTVNRITAPCGTRGDTQSRPRWPSMIDRHIESPIPRPSDFVVKKGSKIRCAMSGSNPMPVSSTVTSTLPGSARLEDTINSRVRSSTPLIASMPFMIKFSNTCCN
jgi:hypothetical protein